MRRSVSVISDCELAQRRARGRGAAPRAPRRGRSASAYSSWASGLTGPELLAPAGQALDPRLQRLALLARPAPRRGLGGELEPLREPGQLGLRPRPRWSRACWAATSATVTASPRSRRRPWSVGLAVGEGAQLAGQALAGRAVGAQLGLQRGDALADRRLDRLQRGDEPLGGRAERSAALQLRPGGGEPLGCWAARACSACSASRRSAASAASTSARRRPDGPSSGADRRCSISHSARRTSSAAASRSRDGGAQLAVGLGAGGVGLGHRRPTARSASWPAVLLGAVGPLGRGQQRRRAGCARPARGPPRPRAPGAARAPRRTTPGPARVTAMPAKSPGTSSQPLHHPRVGEQGASELGAVPIAGDPVGQRLGARRPAAGRPASRRRLRRRAALPPSAPAESSSTPPAITSGTTAARSRPPSAAATASS